MLLSNNIDSFQIISLSFLELNSKWSANTKKKMDHGDLPQDVYDHAIQAVVDGRKAGTVAKDFGIQHLTLIYKVTNSKNV